MGIQTAYSFKNVQCTLDGQSVQGFYEGDDAVIIERHADIGTMMIGADGSALFNQSTDRAATINIKLQHTSPTHNLLLRRLAQQEEAGGLISFPFDLIDTRNGEGGNAEQCYIMQSYTLSFGNNATVREWVLVTGEWIRRLPNEDQI